MNNIIANYVRQLPVWRMSAEEVARNIEIFCKKNSIVITEGEPTVGIEKCKNCGMNWYTCLCSHCDYED